MKNILFIISLLTISLVGYSQAVTFGTGNGTYVENSTDFNATNTTEAWAFIKGEQSFAATQDVALNLDSVSGNHTNVAVQLYGRKFSFQTWTTIGSAVNWKGTTADTTIVISNASANRFREYKVGLTGTGTGVTKCDFIYFKAWNQ